MELKPQALSRDGYIIDQRYTDNIPFGRMPSSKNGCGWIAAYNFLKALERDPDPEALVKDFEKTLLLGGYRGMSLIVLMWKLKKQGVPLEFALRPIHAQQLVERSRAGIILYRAGKTNHYAAFRREEDGKLRFFGAVSGREDHRMSLAEFNCNHVKFPLTVTITAK